MPLSKARDKARKRKGRAQIRLHKQLSSLLKSRPVQPKASDTYVNITYPQVDADGNPIYEEGE